MAEYWGLHAMFDGVGEISKITDKTNVEAFARELVEAIDMKAYGNPQVVHFAAHDPSKGGFTLTQLIETSNISGHYVDATGEYYIDIFSCKPFKARDAKRVIDKYFGTKSCRYRTVKRKAPSVDNQ